MHFLQYYSPNYLFEKKTLIWAFRLPKSQWTPSLYAKDPEIETVNREGKYMYVYLFFHCMLHLLWILFSQVRVLFTDYVPAMCQCVKRWFHHYICNAMTSEHSCHSTVYTSPNVVRNIFGDKSTFYALMVMLLRLFGAKLLVWDLE